MFPTFSEPTPSDTTPERVLREPQVTEMTGGLSHSQLWKLMKEGAFPRPFKIGRRSIGWLQSEVQAWIRERAAQR